MFIVSDLRGEDGKSYRGVRQQFVKLGGARGDQVAIVSGVKAGEEIVTSGVFKLRNGAAVVVNNKARSRAEAGGRIARDSRSDSLRSLMRFTDLFVKRPVLAIVVNLVILIAGLQSIRSLSVRQYPRSDIAVVKVSTVYTGANADLVRGFITTPLERVIASADGIDYMESSSAQSLSTITVHLKLNYDTNDALTQIQAKVAQVRNDLPPEAEAPIIEVENADTQFAALYLSFASADLDQNQITDYLIRVVQPRLSAISGVQRADILGDRTFAMRIWLKPDRMAAHGISPTMLREALARNNYLSALGRTKGSMVSVNLVANTDLRTPEEFRQLIVKEEDRVVVRLGDVADVVLGAENYEEDVRFNGQTAVFMGIWVLPTANSLEVIERVRDEDPAHPGADAGRHEGEHSVRRDRLHRRRDRRSAHDAERDADHRHPGDLPLPRIAALRADPDRRDPDLADRRRLPDARRRIHDQPAHAARDRPLRRLGGGRCDCDGGERGAASPDGETAGAGGDRWRARARRTDRGDDDHAGRGLRAGRHPGWSDRRAVPRIRVHARRRGDRLGRRGADAVADDGREAAALGSERARIRGLDQPAVRQPASRLREPADRHAALPAGGVRVLGDRRGADGPVLHVLAARARARRGSGRRLLRAADVGELHARSDADVRGAGGRCVSGAAGDGEHLPVDVSDGRIRRLRDEAVERAHAHDRAAADGDRGTVVADPRHPRDSADTAAAARWRRLSRWIS